MSDPDINGLKSKQLQDKVYQQFNGIHSSQSSRSSSPTVKPNQNQLSQLPMHRLIPQSQLPPTRSPLTTSAYQDGGCGLNYVESSKLSMPSSGSILPDIGKSTSLPSDIPTTGNGSSTVPILKNLSQQLPQKSSSNIMGMSNPPLQTNVTQKTNHRPGFQNPQVNSIPSVFCNNVEQQKLDNQPQYKTKFPQHYQHQIPLNNQQQSFISQPTPQLHNSSRVSSQTSLPNQNNLNKITPSFPQSNNSSNVSNLQNNSIQFNSQLSTVNTNLSDLNITNSSFWPTIDPSNSGRSISQSTTQSLPQNKQPGLTQPSIFPPNISNIQPMYNGPPHSAPTLVKQNKNVFSSKYPTVASTMPPTQFANPQYHNNFQQVQKQYSQQNIIKPQYPVENVQEPYPGSGIIQGGFNKFWGRENIDLLQTPSILPPTKVEAPKINLGNDTLNQANCSPDIFRCTMTKIPENSSLLQKSRLPLGVLIHPFRDLNHLPVIQCNVIVRCRACRTYINPFVLFVDNKRWKCNLCYRINELPEEFQYDPLTKTYGDPSRRPEIKSSTLEYIAPGEYMLRPPQPAVYLFLLDVSQLAIESGYLQIVTKMLLNELKNLPGDARTQIGFVGYDSAIHFYSLPEGITQPHEMTVLDVDDVFLPTPDNLLVNLKDRMDLVIDLLTLLPIKYANSYDTNSALGAALQVAYKMISATGGRVTVFQASLPNTGPGALIAREDPSQRSSIEVAHLNPANDFYKRLALECSGQQIAVDLFLINSQYIDLATISGISRFSGGCIHHFPLLKPTKPMLCENFARCFRRYLTRKIGFEAVMRIRCTRGLSIHTFHGNFFVRSTDLLSLPNINPDAGFGMQVAIEESLADVQSVCFQAALLYTSSKGERRIRVHTMCLPVASTLHDIIYSADQQCIVGLLSKMAVDRSMQSNLSDAREAFINVAIDILSSYKMSLNLGSPVTGLLAPNNLSLLPLYISAMLKHRAFRIGSSTRLDDRVMAMIDMKTKPLNLLMQQVYPDLYPIHELEKQQIIINSEEESVSVPPKLQLTARCLENKGAFLMDMGEHMIILVCPNVSLEFLNEVLGVPHYNALPDEMFEIPILDSIRNQRLYQFINYLNEDKPFVPTVQIIRDNSTNRTVFFERLIEDRVENALSYHEFLQHLKTQVK